MLPCAALILASLAAAPQAEPTSAPVPSGINAEAAEVLRRADEAVGGRAAMESLESTELVLVTANSMGEVRLEIRWHRDGPMVVRQVIPDRGVDIERGTDGRVSWTYERPAGKFALAPASKFPFPPGLAHVYDIVGDLRRTDWASTDVSHGFPFGGTSSDRVTFREQGPGYVEVFFDSSSGLPLGSQRFARDGVVATELVRYTGWRQAGPILVATEREINMRQSVSAVSMPVLQVNTLKPSDFGPPEVACAALREGPQP